MKTKSFIALSMLAAATMLASCNKAQLAPEDGLDGYMTLQVVGQMDATTKTTPGEGGTEAGTAAENGITSLLVLLCTESSTTVSYAYTVESASLTTINGGVKTDPIETVAGKYNVYVVANPTTDMLDADADIKGKVITDVTEALMKSTYAAENKFMMFSESHTSDASVGKSIKITADNDYDHPASCETIKLDRLAVKITSANQATVDISKITDALAGEFPAVTAITLESFKLVNGAKKVNLMQQWSKTATEQGLQAPWQNNLITPAMAYDGTSTVDFYNHINEFRTITIDEGTKAFTAAKDLYANVASYGSSGTDAIYCMENNPSYASNAVATPYFGNTTGLVYKWKVSVTGSDGKAGENCFYGYDGKYYASLQTLANDYPGVFDPATGATAAEKLAAAEQELVNAYAATDKEEEISKFRVKYGIKVYTDGNMYYTYFIKDENYKDASDNLYHAVMRNTVYKLTVKALSRIGTDIPGGWTPDTSFPNDPIDPDEVYMVVAVSVNPWVVSSSDVTLQ